MRWKQVVQRKPYHGDLRYSTVFAWLPIRCENGDCAWLEKVNLVEEYKLIQQDIGLIRNLNNKKVRFLWKRGENKWHVIIVRTVILMIVMMVGIAIKIVKVLS